MLLFLFLTPACLYIIQIKRYKDNIIADNFAFDDEEKIIVTLPDDVTVNRIRHSRKS